jgi:hypothetical protein
MDSNDGKNYTLNTVTATSKYEFGCQKPTPGRYP